MSVVLVGLALAAYALWRVWEFVRGFVPRRLLIVLIVIALVAATYRYVAAMSPTDALLGIGALVAYALLAGLGRRARERRATALRERAAWRARAVSLPRRPVAPPPPQLNHGDEG
jgi:hypothetical protein